MHNDLTFFTNEPERNLYDRFTKILRSNTQFFDILVGYFRTSGFNLMYDALAEVEKIRILVGLNVDNQTVEILREANEQLSFEALSHQKACEEYKKALVDEFSKSEDTYATEKSVEIFIEWLKNKKIEMRMYTQAPIHAKVYIMRKDMEKVPDQYGSVITGSSNFSMAGLKNNLEFNVELKDSRDVSFALEKFEELWKQSVDISEDYIETIQTDTWLRDNISPYELYLKTLYEFFKEQINEDKTSTIDALLPEGFMQLQYQKDAVIQAEKILEAYNGVFLSDVVGLGKTFISALLAKKVRKKGRILVICPPTLTDYWKEVLDEFDVTATVESLGRLESLVEKGTNKYKYIFIDEAHRFRNQDTQSFSLLHNICFGKKVVLISATPQNNYASDIENQIYLFQPKHNCTIIPNMKNIEAYFNKLDAKLKKVKDSPELYSKQLKANSEEIRDKVLRNIMVRRTRKEIVEYYGEDLRNQGLIFPEVAPPEKIIYTFNDHIEYVFNETIATIKRLDYTRYSPLLHLKQPQGKYNSLLVSQNNMSGFMKSMLVKRLESSFFAFKRTLGRFINSYEQFIAMCEKGDVYISKKINVYDLVDNGDDDKLMEFVKSEEVQHFKLSDFKPSFLPSLKRDLSMLVELQEHWEAIDEDPKLEHFIEELETNDLLKKQVIIFTESKETAEYVGGYLESMYPKQVAVFSSKGTHAQKVEIQKNFDPRVEKEEQKNDIRFLVTTDILAEGINLHRCNVLINYDLPWNPTRIMQRVGRVNRVGTQHDKIYVFNFFPTSQAKPHLSLEENIKFKLQAFYDTLGEDLKYLSDSEEISSHKLYEILTTGGELEEDGESINLELSYLKEIRAIRDNNEKLFEKVKRIPAKSKTARNDSKLKEATISFIRKDMLKCFFLTQKDSTKEISFLEAIQYLQADDSVEGQRTVEKYYEQLEANKVAFDKKLLEEEIITYEKPGKLAGNDKKIMDYLMYLSSLSVFTDIEDKKIEKMKTLWEEGCIPKNLSKKIVSDIKGLMDPFEIYNAMVENVPNRYFNEKNEEQDSKKIAKQVILSEYFYGEENN